MLKLSQAYGRIKPPRPGKRGGRELPCDCGGEFFITADYGTVCYFTCDTCKATERVTYGW